MHTTFRAGYPTGGVGSLSFEMRWTYSRENARCSVHYKGESQVPAVKSLENPCFREQDRHFLTEQCSATQADYRSSSVVYPRYQLESI